MKEGKVNIINTLIKYGQDTSPDHIFIFLFNNFINDIK